MIVEGERIEVSVDGKKMIAVKDSEIGRGKVAIFSEQSLPLTVIDDFIVRALGKKGVLGKNINRNKIQFIAENSNSSSSPSIVYGLMSSISASSFSRLSRPSRLSRFSSSTEKGPNEENDYSFELNELTNSSTLEPLNSSIPDFSPDPIYQTTSSLPPNEIVYYYHHDHLGNIRAVTDSNGNVVERHDLYPFGEEISQSQSKDQYLFTGKPRDSESGLDYFGARYYSSALSRFLSPDMNSFNLANPQTLNRYTYCRNNPLRYIDPDGEYEREFHFWITAITAYMAGYDIGEAWSIAAANQYTDFNPSTTSVTIEGFFAHFGIGDNPQARDWHFCTDARLSQLENEAMGSMTFTPKGRFLHAMQDSEGAHSPFIKSADHWGKKGVDDPSNNVDKAMYIVEETFKKLVKFKTGREQLNDKERATFEKYKADIQKALSIKNRRERYLALKKIWDSITEERRKEWERSKESIKSGGRASHGQN
jgi:RHS repeat-associated protein